MSRTTQEIADEVIHTLLNAEPDIVIHRYDACSSNSIYLKFDYGVANSLRISDHTGKQHLNYMFNINNNIKRQHTEYHNFTMYFYTFDQVQELCDHIVKRRNSKATRSNGKYINIMREYEHKSANEKGFWNKAVKIIKRG